MGARIQTNVGALVARRQILTATQRVLASVRGLGQAPHVGDVGETAHAERMRAETRAFARAAHTTLQGVGLASASESALREVSASLGRMRELAARGAAGGGEDLERAFEVERAALAGLAGDRGGVSLDLGLGSGREFELPALDASPTGLGLDGLSVAEPLGAGVALAQLDAALEVVSRARTVLEADRATLIGHHAGLERAATGRLGEEPPKDPAAAEAWAATLVPRILRDADGATHAHHELPPDAAAELLAES